jgi:hypothetical protein
VRGVGVCVSHVGMLVFVGMRPVMGVRFGHGVLSQREICCIPSSFHPGARRLRGDSATAFSPLSPR